MKRYALLGGMILLLLAVPAALEAETVPHIQGTSQVQGWSIDVKGSTGTFTADGESWEIEFIGRSLGLNGFLHTLEFLGRKPDNFIDLQVLVNVSGDSFWIFAFNYKEGRAEWGFFEGDYDMRGLSAEPTQLDGYAPAGKVPDYQGQDFRISSEASEISPHGGTVSLPELRINVYPITQVKVTEVWSEFWSVGIDPESRHTYFLILYTISPNAVIVDLWTGRVFSLPLGQATITGDTVQLSHDVSF